MTTDDRQPITATGPNADQITYWNDTAGPKWVALHEVIDRQIRPLGIEVMERAAIGAGEHVLDVGCGCGETSIELGRRVGPSGLVTGIDISAVMLERAREQVEREGLRNVRFENADAQTWGVPPERFDVLYSRFGVMFFVEPRAAFANLATCSRRGGRLAFVCWQPLAQNPWMLVPLLAAAQHVDLPSPPAPGAPGPFSFGDADRVRGILTDAGFAGVDIAPMNEVLTVGGGADLDRTVDFIVQMGPVGAVLRDAGPEVLPAVNAAVREALAPYDTPEGVRMESAAWVVTARRP